MTLLVLPLWLASVSGWVVGVVICEATRLAEKLITKEV